MSGPGSSMRSNCEQRGGWKRKGKGGGGEAKRMKISEGCNSQQAEEMSSRMDPCQSLPPEIFRRILSSLSFISMRHAMLVSWKFHFLSSLILFVTRWAEDGAILLDAPYSGANSGSQIPVAISLCNCAMQWRNANGVMVSWCNGVIKLWCNGANGVMLWSCNSVMVSWNVAE